MSLRSFGIFVIFALLVDVALDDVEEVSLARRPRFRVVLPPPASELGELGGESLTVVMVDKFESSDDGGNKLAPG